MSRRLTFLRAACAFVTVVGCGGGNDGGGGSAGPNTIAGAVDGPPWSRITSAHWIGMPSPGSPATIVFLLEQRVDCAGVSFVNWDDLVGESRILEIGLEAEAVRTFSVPAQAYVAYSKGAYNPDADGGNVTVTGIVPSTKITGTFDAKYRTDGLRGAFEATYCPTGVEP